MARFLLHLLSPSLILVLLLLLLSSSPVLSKSKRQKVEAEYKNRRRDCETKLPESEGGCVPPRGVPFYAEEAQNCVNKCTEPACYEEVYVNGGGALEDGEIDMERQRAFTTCARKKFRDNKKMREKLRKEGSGGGGGGGGGGGAEVAASGVGIVEEEEDQEPSTTSDAIPEE